MSVFLSLSLYPIVVSTSKVQQWSCVSVALQLQGSSTWTHLDPITILSETHFSISTILTDPSLFSSLPLLPANSTSFNFNHLQTPLVSPLQPLLQSLLAMKKISFQQILRSRRPKNPIAAWVFFFLVTSLSLMFSQIICVCFSLYNYNFFKF